MKKVKIVLACLLALPALYFIVVYAASEAGGEVVTLYRLNGDGSESQVRLWVVDDGNSALIEHGAADAVWIQALTENNVLRLTRNGVTNQYQASVAADAHALYHRLRAEKYGLADDVIAMATGNSPAACKRLPVRLQLP